MEKDNINLLVYTKKNDRRIVWEKVTSAALFSRCVLPMPRRSDPPVENRRIGKAVMVIFIMTCHYVMYRTVRGHGDVSVKLTGIRLWNNANHQRGWKY